MIQENILKNLIVIVLAALFFPLQFRAFAAVQPDQISDLLLVLSVLLVTVCFANFAFTYEKSKLKIPSSRLLAHISTFIFMLLIALMLEGTVLAVNAVYPSFTGIITIYSVLLYVGVVLYDFWDLSLAK